MTSLKPVRGQWRWDNFHFLLCLFQLLLATSGVIRGLGYMLGSSSGSLTVVEDALPLSWWGLAFLASSLLIPLGMGLRRYGPQIAGHLLLGALYTGLGIGLGVDVLQDARWSSLGAVFGLIALPGLGGVALVFALAGQRRRHKLRGGDS